MISRLSHESKDHLKKPDDIEQDHEEDKTEWNASLRPQTEEDDELLVIQTMPLKKSHDGQECHDIEDEEGTKPTMYITKIDGGELKAGRIHHGFRMDRTRLMNYEDEAVELSQGTLRESLHLATI